MRSHRPPRLSVLGICRSKIRFVRPKWQNTLVQVNQILPISIRCDTCGNHICEGTHLKSWKEPVVGEGIGIIRFYFDCSKCSSKISLKLYPNLPHLVVESGATRIWEEEVQEIGHPIKSLQIDDINSIKKYKDQDSEGKEDHEDEEDQDSEDDDEAVNNALKKRKLSDQESLDKPADSLTKATTS